MILFAIGVPPEPVPYEDMVATYMIGIDPVYESNIDCNAYFITVYDVGEVWNWSYPARLLDIDLSRFQIKIIDDPMIFMRKKN